MLAFHQCIKWYSSGSQFGVRTWGHRRDRLVLSQSLGAARSPSDLVLPANTFIFPWLAGCGEFGKHWLWDQQRWPWDTQALRLGLLWLWDGEQWVRRVCRRPSSWVFRAPAPHWRRRCIIRQAENDPCAPRSRQQHVIFSLPFWRLVSLFELTFLQVDFLCL